MWYQSEPILTKHSLDIKAIICGFIELAINNQWDNQQENVTMNASTVSWPVYPYAVVIQCIRMFLVRI
jgi:hypothetical protein